jgi:hypothetical protein
MKSSTSFEICCGDQNSGVLGKRLTLFLFVSVDSKWEGRFDAGDKFGHVLVNVGLGNCSIGAANVSDEVTKGDCIKIFGRVIKFHIINIVNGHRELVPCDCVDNYV